VLTVTVLHDHNVSDSVDITNSSLSSRPRQRARGLVVILNFIVCYYPSAIHRGLDGENSLELFVTDELDILAIGDKIVGLRCRVIECDVHHAVAELTDSSRSILMFPVSVVEVWETMCYLHYNLELIYALVVIDHRLPRAANCPHILEGVVVVVLSEVDRF
jgi:hypothetical protein